jgi:hypothetical protein
VPPDAGQGTAARSGITVLRRALFSDIHTSQFDQWASNIMGNA